MEELYKYRADVKSYDFDHNPNGELVMNVVYFKEELLANYLNRDDVIVNSILRVSPERVLVSFSLTGDYQIEYVGRVENWQTVHGASIEHYENHVLEDLSFGYYLHLGDVEDFNLNSDSYSGIGQKMNAELVITSESKLFDSKLLIKEIEEALSKQDYKVEIDFGIEDDSTDQTETEDIVEETQEKATGYIWANRILTGFLYGLLTLGLGSVFMSTDIASNVLSMVASALVMVLSFKFSDVQDKAFAKLIDLFRGSFILGFLYAFVPMVDVTISEKYANKGILVFSFVMAGYILLSYFLSDDNAK